MNAKTIRAQGEPAGDVARLTFPEGCAVWNTGEDKASRLTRHQDGRQGRLLTDGGKP